MAQPQIGTWASIFLTPRLGSGDPRLLIAERTGPWCSSVQAVGSQGASFFYSVDGEPHLFGGANCAAGLDHGQPPASAAQAQLLNAVCQVTDGAAA